MPAVELHVTWPPGWGIPVVGQTVILPDGSGGPVEQVIWDLQAKCLKVGLR